MVIEVTIGPVSSSSAAAWLAAARGSVSALREEQRLAVPWDVLAAFEHFVTMWEAHLAAHGETFLWSGVIDEQIVRQIGMHWARLTSIGRGSDVTTLANAPQEAEAFRASIAAGVASALAASSPMLAAAFTMAAPGSHQPEPSGGGATTRVLLVDDEEDIRLLLRVWLERSHDFEIAGEAWDGHGAIQAARATHPDVVVLDVHLPGLSGLDAMPLIRAAAPGCALVVYSLDDHPGAALSAGADCFVAKRSPLPNLVDAVRAAAHGSVHGTSMGKIGSPEHLNAGTPDGDARPRSDGDGVPGRQPRGAS